MVMNLCYVALRWRFVKKTTVRALVVVRVNRLLRESFCFFKGGVNLAEAEFIFKNTVEPFGNRVFIAMIVFGHTNLNVFIY